MLRLATAALAALALVAFTAPPAQARPKERYYFEVTSVNLADGIPADVAGRVRAQLAAELERQDAIVTELPADAPDPAAAPKDFKSYLNKNKLRAFKVKVDVTEYTRRVEPMPDGRRGQRLQVSVAIRMFGETIPDRVMAFAGAGSAAIKLDIGKKVRAADDEEAHAAAFEPAVADAVEESLRKLQLPPPAANKSKKKRGKK